MLVLSRKKNEEIIIVTAHGEEIILRISDVNSGCAKIGLQADRSIRIMRGELLSEAGNRFGHQEKQFA